MIKTKGIMLVVSGPSGVGKGTICEHLVKENPDIFLSVSATSRKPRDGEVEGVHYYFKTCEEFDEMIQNDELLEYAHYVTSTYGTPKAPCLNQIEQGNTVVLEIEVQGGMKVKEKHPDTVMIFVVPPNIKELECRLRGRGTEDEAIIQKRLKRAHDEFEHIDDYDYIIVNDTIEAAAQRIKAIITAEQIKVKNFSKTIKKELGL